AAYSGGPWPEAFVEPTAVGAALPEMPLFLTPDVYIPVPLDATYQSAWEAVPAFWRDVLTSPPTAGGGGIDAGLLYRSAESDFPLPIFVDLSAPLLHNKTSVNDQKYGRARGSRRGPLVGRALKVREDARDCVRPE